MSHKIILFVTYLIVGAFFVGVKACDQYQCASIVSKCMLDQSCKCDWANGTNSVCYTDCMRCLGHKGFMECCSCVQMCPTNHQIGKAVVVDHHSVVEHFEGVPALFEQFTKLKINWKVLTVHIKPTTTNSSNNSSALEPSSNHRRHHHNRHDHQKHHHQTQDQAANTKLCSVLYLNKCTLMPYCSVICRSTGARSYRWFFSGCCQCIGDHCPVNGLDMSECRFCPRKTDTNEREEEQEEEDDYDNENSL